MSKYSGNTLGRLERISQALHSIEHVNGGASAQNNAIWMTNACILAIPTPIRTTLESRSKTRGENTQSSHPIPNLSPVNWVQRETPKILNFRIVEYPTNPISGNVKLTFPV
jgi:hypothetical protein